MYKAFDVQTNVAFDTYGFGAFSASCTSSLSWIQSWPMFFAIKTNFIDDLSQCFGAYPFWPFNGWGGKKDLDDSTLKIQIRDVVPTTPV